MTNIEMIGAWKILKMIFFNFFQNSVKYNEREGFIYVNLSLMNIIIENKSKQENNLIIKNSRFRERNRKREESIPI